MSIQFGQFSRSQYSPPAFLNASVVEKNGTGGEWKSEKLSDKDMFLNLLSKSVFYVSLSLKDKFKKNATITYVESYSEKVLLCFSQSNSKNGGLGIL